MAHSDNNINRQPNPDGASSSDETLKLAQCLMPEPPSAKLKGAIAGNLIDRRLHEIAWRVYDAVVDAANGVTDLLFGSPAAGDRLGGAVEIVLRLQQLNAAVAGVLFGALWPAVGLPTASDVDAIGREVRSMREELREAAERREMENPLLAAARKVAAYQFPASSDWPGRGRVEVGKDIGH